MAKLTKSNRPMNPRMTQPGDIVVRKSSYGVDAQYLMVGEWPGRGTRTLMNLKTGKNEQIDEHALEDLRLTTGIIELMNERI